MQHSWQRHSSRSLRYGQSLGQQCDVDRLTDPEAAGLLRQCLDHVDELGALLEAVDYRWRELRLARYETHPRGEVFSATVAVHSNGIAISEVCQHCLWYKEAHLEVARRQQCQHGAASRYHFSRAVINLLDGAFDRTKHRAAR